MYFAFPGSSDISSDLVNLRVPGTTTVRSQTVDNLAPQHPSVSKSLSDSNTGKPSITKSPHSMSNISVNNTHPRPKNPQTNASPRPQITCTNSEGSTGSSGAGSNDAISCDNAFSDLEGDDDLSDTDTDDEWDGLETTLV